MARKKAEESNTAATPQTEASDTKVTLEFLTVAVGQPGQPAAEFYAAALAVILGSITLEQAAERLMSHYAGLPYEKQVQWVGGMDEAVARLQSVVRELPRRVIVK